MLTFVSVKSAEKILLLDNYDSFVYNLLHLVHTLGYKNVTVCRNDQIAIEDVAAYSKIILSPGPGVPSEAGLLLPIIGAYAQEKPILGVCLGEQAIAEAFGGRIHSLPTVFHGKATEIDVIAEDLLFRGLPSCLVVGRYHSWVVDSETLPACLITTAVDKEGQIMALRHRELPVYGVQFHPESILTPFGAAMVQNFLRYT